MSDQQAGYDVAIEVDPAYAGECSPPELQAIAARTLHIEGVAGPLELGVWITDEAELHALNRTYRGVDSSTDVLSFGEEQDKAVPFVNAPETPRSLGDIAISFPHVARQAAEYGHSRQRELAYLLVHGVLHLLGYDHENPDDAATMRRHEEAVLGVLQITRGSDHGTDAS